MGNPGLPGMGAPPPGYIAVPNGAGGESFVPDPSSPPPAPPASAGAVHPGLPGMAAPPPGYYAVPNGAGGESFLPDPASPAPGSPAAPGTAPAPTAGTPAQQDANAIIQQQLNAWGLSGLQGWAWNEITQGATANQVEADLYSTPEFKNEYGVIFQRQAKGLTPITPADVLNYRQTATQLAQAAGLPAGFMTKQLADEFIGNDVSASELQTRIDSAKTAIYNADPNQQAVLQQLYGVGLTPGAIAAHYLDPGLALPVLQKQLQASQIGGLALDQGLSVGGQGLSQGLLERLAGQGVTTNQGQAAFGKVSAEQNLLSPLTGERGSAISLDSATQAALGGDTTTDLAIQREQAARLAQFDGGGNGNDGVQSSGILAFQSQ